MGEPVNTSARESLKHRTGNLEGSVRSRGKEAQAPRRATSCIVKPLAMSNWGETSTSGCGGRAPKITTFATPCTAYRAGRSPVLAMAVRCSSDMPRVA